jgi:hypothetical protein
MLYEFVATTGAVAQTCHNLPGEVEALSMLKTGELLFGLHKASDTGIHAFDIESCSVTDSVLVETSYTDLTEFGNEKPLPIFEQINDNFSQFN